MACFRQATMDATTLEAYTQVLVQEDLRAFQVAMATISETKREPGETAFPELSYVLEVMRKTTSCYLGEMPPDSRPIYAAYLLESSPSGEPSHASPSSRERR
jgi:hypothetical protein